jgi:hypothetical protein
MDQGSCEAPNRSEMGGKQRCMRPPCLQPGKLQPANGKCFKPVPRREGGKDEVVRLQLAAWGWVKSQSASGKGGGEARPHESLELAVPRHPRHPVYELRAASSEQRVRDAECKNTKHQGRGENAMATAEEGPWI